MTEVKHTQRVIKFRVWDPFYNKMLDHEWLKAAKVVYDALVDNPRKDLVIMQFTGLNDKEGTPIYEGDVVEHEKWVSVGKYEKCIGVVKYKGVGFTCECIGDWEGSNAELNSNAKVIGNVFSHPHLLNKQVK